MTISRRGPGRPRIGRTVHWTIPEEIIRELEARASREGIPVAEVVRRLLRAALERE